jgi:hypothetical protein
MKTAEWILIVVVMIFPNIYYDKQGNTYQDAIVKYGDEYRVMSLNKSIIYLKDSADQQITLKDSVGHTAQSPSIDNGFYAQGANAAIYNTDFDAAPKITTELIIDELNGLHQKPLGTD